MNLILLMFIGFFNNARSESSPKYDLEVSVISNVTMGEHKTSIYRIKDDGAYTEVWKESNSGMICNLVMDQGVQRKYLTASCLALIPSGNRVSEKYSYKFEVPLECSKHYSESTALDFFVGVSGLIGANKNFKIWCNNISYYERLKEIFLN